MEKKAHIPLIVLAIFSISILLVFDYGTKPAFAVNVAFDLTSDSTNNKTFFASATHQFVIVPSGHNGKVSEIMGFIDSTDSSPVITEITIKPRLGVATCSSGCTDATTVGIVGNNWKGGTDALWCGITHCFTYWISSNSSYPHQLLRINEASHVIDGYMNITFSQNIQKVIWGHDQTGVGIGGITLFRSQLGAGTDGDLIITGGTSIMGDSSRLSALITSSSGSVTVTDITGCYNCGGIAGTNRIIITGQDTGTAGTQVRVFNPNTLANVCGQTGVQIAGGGVINAGILQYTGDTKNTFFITRSDDTIREYDLSCNIITSSITTANTGVQARIRDLEVDTSNKYYYIYHGSLQSIATVTRMNLTSPTSLLAFEELSTLPAVNAGQAYQSMALDVLHRVMLVGHSTAIIREFFLNGNTASNIQGNNTACIDTVEGAGQQLICFYDTDGDGFPDVGLGGNTMVFRAGTNTTTATATWGCALGVSDSLCTNLNPRTNGVGYVLLAIALIGSAVGLMIIGHKTNHSLSEISPVFWIMIVLAWTGGLAGLQYIDWTLFFAGIVVCAGIGGLGIYQKFYAGKGG